MDEVMQRFSGGLCVIRCTLYLTLGGEKQFEIRTPVIDEADTQALAFLQDYVYARIYNVICTLGGASTQLSVGDDDRQAQRLLRDLNRDCIPASFPTASTARHSRNSMLTSTKTLQRRLARAGSRFPAERNTLHGQAEARGAIGGMKMKTGYARCSTNESKQDIERQVRELKQAGAERVFLEYEHGDAAVKEQLSLLLEQARPGDTIITLEVSRLARSTKQLCEIIDTISQKRLCLVIVGSITMDCRNGHADPMTEAFLQMAGVFSQLELAMIRARVRSGMANARAKGAKIGRPELTADDIPPVFLRHYPAFRNKNLNLSELARVCTMPWWNAMTD